MRHVDAAAAGRIVRRIHLYRRRNLTKKKGSPVQMLVTGDGGNFAAAERHTQRIEPMPRPANDNTAAAELEALRAELASLRAAAAAGQRISYKVSEKGALSVYGLGRFPVTLYRSQWERLLDPSNVTAITAYMVANRDRLATKE